MAREICINFGMKGNRTQYTIHMADERFQTIPTFILND